MLGLAGPNPQITCGPGGMDPSASEKVFFWRLGFWFAEAFWFFRRGGGYALWDRTCRLLAARRGGRFSGVGKGFFRRRGSLIPGDVVFDPSDIENALSGVEAAVVSCREGVGFSGAKQ